VTQDPRSLTNLDARLRKAANAALLKALEGYGLTGQVVEFPEGEEVEVFTRPRIDVEGARFFLRVEVATVPADAERRTEPPKVPVPTRLLLTWRIVPEPVAVVHIDPDTGEGAMTEIHPFLSRLDQQHRGWHRHPSVLVPLLQPISGMGMLGLARAAADAHVLFRRVVDHVEAIEKEKPPRTLKEALGTLRQLDFDYTVSCVDLMREAGLLVEDRKKGMGPSEACTAAFARAAVQHVTSARGHADPATASKAGRAAIARLLLSRFPGAGEATLERCAVVLARFLPVDQTDNILAITTDPEALGEVLGD